MAKKKSKSKKSTAKKSKSTGKTKASTSKKKKVAKSKAKSSKKKATKKQSTKRKSKRVAKPIVVTHDQIAKRAFELWMDRGRPAGQDQTIWHDAERELLGS